MQAGELRNRITINTGATTPDAYGENLPAPTVFATVWAKVTQLSGRELYYAQQQQALATHKVTMRYYAGVTETMSIAWQGGRTLNIVAVNDIDGRHRELELLCQERKQA